MIFRVRSPAALAALAGAGAIAFTGTLVRLADQPPATAAFFRCLYALPPLALLAFVERRRHGPMGMRRRLLAALAGLFFAADLELWHHAIGAVGAGLATVVANLQVVFVGGVAWLMLGERPSRRVAAAVPAAVAGVVLISGVVGAEAYGERPFLGVVLALLTAAAYAGFLLVFRQAGRDLRPPAGMLFDATATCAAALVLVGLALDELAPTPTWPEHGWLLALALSGQVIGYLAIGLSLPRLPAVMTSILLLVQPVLGVGIAAAVVDERPSIVQLAGVGLVLAAIVVATAERQPVRTVARAEAS